MTDTYVFNSANRAEWKALEALYVNQKKPESQIVGVNVNGVGIVGKCVRGPAMYKAISPSNYMEVFGGRDFGAGGAVYGEVWRALNGLGFCWPIVIGRPIPSAAAAATLSLVATATPIVTATASSKGAWANGSVSTGVTIDVVAATDGDANHWDCIVHYGGGSYRIYNINTYSTSDNTLSAVGSNPGNLITLTKVANGRPDNATGLQLGATVAGTDGTLAASDYVTALDAVAGHADTKIVFVVEQCVDSTGQDTVNEEVVRLAALYPDKIFVTWGGTYAAAATDVTTKGNIANVTTVDNVIYCYNTQYTYDKAADANIAAGAHVLMASILCQTEPDVNPGDFDNLPMAAAIKQLGNESLSRDELKALKAAGICQLEKIPEGFLFHSGVTTSGKEITDVRCAQFLIASMADVLKYDVKKPFTESLTQGIVSKVTAFLLGLQTAERVVDKDSDEKGPAWDVRFVQTDTDRSQNIAILRTSVRTLPHANTIVLETNMGTGVTNVVR